MGDLKSCRAIFGKKLSSLQKDANLSVKRH